MVAGAPARYDLRIAVPGEATLRAPVGLREITWDGDGLELNGEPLVLRGAALPADARGHGDALTGARRGQDHRRPARGRRERDALAAAARHRACSTRLDAAGILVWQEIGPWEPAGRWRAETPAQIAAARDRALRAAEAGQAHPSVLAWTLTNEAPGQGHPAQQQYVRQTARALHELDPDASRGRRPVGLGAAPPEPGRLFERLDAIGVTDYIGWYEARPDCRRRRRRWPRDRIAHLRACFPTSRSSSPSSARSAARASRATGSAACASRRAARPRLRELHAEPGSGMLVWSLRDCRRRCRASAWSGCSGRSPATWLSSAS